VSVPRGFFETLDNCDAAAPAFVRGVLLEAAQYNAMSPSQVIDAQTPPRWTLYGGPLSTKQLAEQWNDYMAFWAFGSGKIWLSLGTCCVVPDYQIKWPPDQSFRWQWVWEPENPRRVSRVWTGSQYKWVYV
jgi:hypothetical protein